MTDKKKLRGLWWWTDRWLRSTAFTDMNLEQQGAYRNLLDAACLRDGLLPADDYALAKMCGDALAWDRVRDVVLRWFTLTEDGYRNETLDAVMAESQRRAANTAKWRGGVKTEPKPKAPAKATAGHKMAFKGQRFIVWTWLHEDFVRALGATKFDLLAWYPKLDAEMAATGEPIVDEQKWLRDRLYKDAKLPLPNLMRGRPELVERSNVPSVEESERRRAALRAGAQ